MNNNRCLMCGQIIPEGIQVCPTCEENVMESSQKANTIKFENRYSYKQHKNCGNEFGKQK